MTGEIPAELGQLQNLKVLDLSFNNLWGKIPRELGQIQGIQLLALNRNLLEGTIPEEFENLLNLTGLHLNGNMLTGAIPLSLLRCQSLTNLFLDRNQFYGDLPSELGRWQHMRLLRLSQNRFTGEIPSSLCQMASLEGLSLDENQFRGQIPSCVGELPELVVLDLSWNQLSGKIPRLANLKMRHLDLEANKLSGKIPKDLGQLRQLYALHLSHNGLEGELPIELGALEKLQYLYLNDNKILGEIPPSFGQMLELSVMDLAHNNLRGRIPAELGQLQELTFLDLCDNQLSGGIPPELGQLANLLSLGLSYNRLSGEIPVQLKQMAALDSLALRSNQFTGDLAALEGWKFWNLDLGFNAFSGRVSKIWVADALDLSHNHFSGNLDELASGLCHNGTVQVRGLHLNHNNFEGFVPDCFLQSETLLRLSLNSNQLEGPIPQIAAVNLVALTLHHNHLSGNLPSFHSSPQLSILTLHDNSLEGVLHPIRLVSACVDNPSYTLLGLSCIALKLSMSDIDGKQNCESLGLHDRAFSRKHREVLQNCPHACGVCPSFASSKATFHSNRFSCNVPAKMSIGTLHATAVMGNMLGDGTMLNASWISPEEIQSFLYFSPRVWRANMFILSVISSLLACMIVFGKSLRRRLQKVFWNFSQTCLEARAMRRTAEYNVGMLRVSSLTFCLSCPLIGLFWLGTGYHTCSPPLSQFTAANLRTNSWVDIGVVGIWCTMTIFFRCAIFCMQGHTENGFVRKRERFAHCKLMCFNIVAWLLWISIAIVLSLPSILFAVAQALPAHNTSGLSPNMLSGVHMAAPYLIVFIDVWIAVPLSTIYSERSGIERSRLVMTLRLFSAWFLSLLTTTFLHENCFGGWKLFWAVCQENAPERHFFEWNLWDEELLNPTTDMCSLKFSWPQGRCTRSVVDGLTSLLLKKLLFRSIGMPLLTMLSWCLSRPQDSEETEDGRHLLFMGCWPVTTSMLKPYNQVTLLTTYLEVLFFWTPFIPLLSVGVLFLASANLFLLDIGVWQFGFRAPTNARNSNATLSKGYLMFALFAGCCFQLWHAFGTKMYGRHMIWLNLAAAALPMPSRLWRLDWFWSCTIDESGKECEGSIELAEQSEQLAA